MQHTPARLSNPVGRQQRVPRAAAVLRPYLSQPVWTGKPDADSHVDYPLFATPAAGSGTMGFAISDVRAGTEDWTYNNGNLPINGAIDIAFGPSYESQTIGNPTVAYRWQRNGSGIAGAASWKYTVQAADAGASLRSMLTFGGVQVPSNATQVA